ncbi:glycosyltransferase [bacterium]|nr:glycosyltransferase [bacterium]MBT6831867.1 glycosyltransferase [bacterium]MBT6996521.1 glycosyltransferase [bacterium]MBT7773014.1 glycosyltransferase [bacterium]
MDFSSKKVAIVADWLTSRGGAERVIFSLAKLFPNATIFTSVFDETAFPELSNRDVRCTWLQKLPKKIRKKHQFLLPFFPGAFSKLDLSEFDLIVSSSSSGFSKCVQKNCSKKTKHVCFCHTPVRFLYHARDEYIFKFPLPWWGKPVRFFLPKILNWLEKIDQRAAKNVDFWIANSNFVGERISKFYHKKSTTIYPGVETQSFAAAGKKKSERKYFLAVGRFIPYKKFDLLVEVFKKNGLKLKLAGRGPDFEKCRELARGAENIEFLGFAPDENLPNLYAGARAFLFPAEEDFGLTPVEAMAAGTPVIFFSRGGATESVGEWGTPFSAQTPESLQRAIDTFLKSEKTLDREKIFERGAEFDEKNFREKFADFLTSLE